MKQIIVSHMKFLCSLIACSLPQMSQDQTVAGYDDGQWYYISGEDNSHGSNLESTQIY